jgi:hypothetical protein
MFRVDFLHGAGNEVHIWPLLNARQALRELDIELTPKPYNDDRTQCLLVTQDQVSENLFREGRLVMILECKDGPHIGMSRQWIPRVSGVLKAGSGCLKPPQLNNRFRGAVWVDRLRSAGCIAQEKPLFSGKRTSLIPSEDLAKIYPFYGWGAWQILVLLGEGQGENVDLDASRHHPVHFSGTTKYLGTEIDDHRKAAASIVESIKGSFCHRGRLPREVYYDTILNSYAVLSPFGWCGPTIRDFEAMLLGAVLIKPDVSYLSTWPPNTHVPYETYIPCRDDFADVPEIVDWISRTWKDWKSWRRRCRKIAWHAMNPKTTAKRFAFLLEGFL